MSRPANANKELIEKLEAEKAALKEEVNKLDLQILVLKKPGLAAYIKAA